MKYQMILIYQFKTLTSLSGCSLFYFGDDSHRWIAELPFPIEILGAKEVDSILRREVFVSGSAPSA